VSERVEDGFGSRPECSEASVMMVIPLRSSTDV
jgi:hypothetical protein